MASPFPGMDPYLEGELWTSFHALFVAEIVRELNRKLTERYVALAQQRFVMAIPGAVSVTMAEVYPDIGITHAGKKTHGTGGTTLTAPLRLDTIMPTRAPHQWVKIVEGATRKLVTVIEFLSPTNKRGLERRRYLRKRDRILLSTVHLLEIDLLRKGKRIPMRTPLPAGDYFIFLSRAANRPETEVWPVAVNEALPRVPVPLLAGDADIVLDLRRVFATVYREGRYQNLIDYSRPPDVPLPAERQAWAEKRLKGR